MEHWSNLVECKHTQVINYKVKTSHSDSVAKKMQISDFLVEKYKSSIISGKADANFWLFSREI